MKADKLLRMLDTMGPDDVANIDKEIAAGEARLEAMRTLRQIMATRLDGQVAEPAKAPAAGGGLGVVTLTPHKLTAATGHPDGENITEQRKRQVAKYLLSAGTAKASTLAKHCGMDNLAGFHWVLKSPWFRTKGDFVELTDEGKIAAAKV